MKHGFGVQTVQVRMVLIRRLRYKALVPVHSVTIKIVY